MAHSKFFPIVLLSVFLLPAFSNAAEEKWEPVLSDEAAKVAPAPKPATGKAESAAVKKTAAKKSAPVVAKKKPAPVVVEKEETPVASEPELKPETISAPSAPSAPESPIVADAPDLDKDKAACMETLQLTVRAPNRERLGAFCDRIARLPTCSSHEGRPIHHMDSSSKDPRGKRILVLGLIHGDEPLAGEMALEWVNRLQKIDHRNDWRVIPLLNPDGLRLKTRMNANGVDLNRNFPTKDWKEVAGTYWKKQGKGDPRRFPGSDAASEPETKCVIAQIKDFKPDFIISVHTPYKVLDFDGPRMAFPRYKDLPWRALGNFPGSLGRYMWKDFSVPVLTVELGNTMVDAAQLQDIVGTFAIDAAKKSGTKTAQVFEVL